MRSQGGVNAGGGILLEAREDVRIRIKSDRDAGMAGALAGDLRMHAFRQQVADMGMPEIVEPQREAKPLDDPAEFLGELARAPGGAVSERTHQVDFLAANSR